MHDWTGSRIREESLRVPCPYCLAREQVPCHAKGDPSHPLEAFPAHSVRIRASKVLEGKS